MFEIEEAVQRNRNQDPPLLSNTEERRLRENMRLKVQENTGMQRFLANALINRREILLEGQDERKEEDEEETPTPPLPLTTPDRLPVALTRH